KEVKILGDIVKALMNKNKTVRVETIKRNIKTGVIEDTPQVPGPVTEAAGTYSMNRKFAESITIGSDISIKRIYNAPTTVKTDKNEYEVDNGFYYMVRTPSGEAKFTNTNNDFSYIWHAALNKYDGFSQRDIVNLMWKYLSDPELKRLAGEPVVQKDFNKGQDRLKNLGVVSGQKFGVPPIEQIVAMKWQHE
ncbi:MAG: hypothetical protein LBF37_01560, partial [Rickettsiales bacterium]|nr:hypothetical protein [Rickettsiales bacterium]